MHPVGPSLCQVVGGGGVTADPGIDLGAQTWLHSVFACPLDKDACVSLIDYAKTNSLVQSGIIVPASQREISRALPCLLRLLRQWYEVMWRLRRAGFTLRGNFCCDNFLLYRPEHQIQVDRRRPAEERFLVRMTGRLHLSRYSRDYAVEDDRTFVWSVRELLSFREHVLEEINKWLKFINDDGVGNEYLVRYHINIMDPRAGFSVLMSFRRRLDYLRRRSLGVYQSIEYMMRDFDGWNTRIEHFQNGLMDEMRLFILKRRGTTLEKGFDPNLEGILKAIRDCSEHQAWRFEQYMLLIIDEDFRGFAEQLYFAMFRAGQLRYLHLENTM